MRIAITGFTGFIGGELSAHFRGNGHQVNGIGRADFAKGAEHIASLIEGTDYLINLAGAPIVKRWTRSYSRELWTSRIDTTRILKEALGLTRQKPRAFISSSAIGYYSSEGIHTEESNQQDPEFLGTLCENWEDEARKAKIFCPTYIIRTGIVLGKNGGALPQMAMPFRLGVGGRMGNGRQMISWIHIRDYITAIEMILEKTPHSEVFNLTAPNPVSNAYFSKQLARVLKRPDFFAVPAFALKLLFGEGAVTLLSGQHVLPQNLLKEGFAFQFEQVEDALQDLLT